jgi:hypothetical protein
MRVRNRKAIKKFDEKTLIQISLRKNSNDIYIYEYASNGIIGKILEKLRTEYNLELKECCRSRCG